MRRHAIFNPSPIVTPFSATSQNPLLPPLPSSKSMNVRPLEGNGENLNTPKISYLKINLPKFGKIGT